MADTQVKELEEDHLKFLFALIESTENINEEEKECAEELLRVSLDKDDPESEEYLTLVAETDGKVSGYICYGNASLSDGAFDIYWILVDGRARRQGVGSILLRDVEQAIRNKNGRLILAETSGRAEYSDTHKFYNRNGYTEEARIKDFYRKGDDKLFFSKVL